ncbi:ORF MSV243 hypothetical protein [Melanoplus sanguinipes entomopoxvirus]|uniref:Uncharacterized protein n=1 Tax=Melanoplus sanguinipes entomopoxvirus TaxID=83191 RepID=Q9YVJ9_MSEPV|nr:ORF MSV243 hypothetical protein [Melanoplus sanguinipes entomopoxvirus]AAC97722.1 ORF MSV243 hypothetical protein [Melanoplus sanguinipes entomopoxvirus 'O']
MHAFHVTKKTKNVIPAMKTFCSMLELLLTKMNFAVHAIQKNVICYFYHVDTFHLAKIAFIKEK